MSKGKFIVIDGADGSGKSTQIKLLIEKLEKKGYKVKKADFPQYGTKSAAPVEEYLNGKYGSPEDVGPLRASIFYAVDRYDASFTLRKWIEQGYIIISDRYVSASMGHQTAKIKDKETRRKFLDWLYRLEYTIFEIPKPDLNIILNVKAEIADKLIAERDNKDYIKNKKRDILENIEHQKKARQAYLEIANQFEDFTVIDCNDDKTILSREDIHEKIWNIVLKEIS